MQNKFNLDYLLSPKSIAVIGESQPIHAGNHVSRLKEHGYSGQIYPVNPRYDEICGYKCYHDVSNLPPGIDNAIIKVRSDLVIPVTRKCLEEKDIKSLTVISAGFAEIGETGVKEQEELSQLAAEFNVPLLGPNCIGYANFNNNIVAFGNTKIGATIKGDVALISQSGGLGSLFNRAQEKGLGFSYLVSTGNEALLGISDFIDYFVENNSTRVILIFMECIRNSLKFIRAAQRALKKRKPIIVLKVGRSAVGKKTAVAHTAALIGGDEAYEAAFRQFGVVSVSDIDELIDTAILFSHYDIPEGNTLGILGISGGASTLLADYAEEFGFTLPELSPPVKEKMSILKFGTPMNPLDLTGQVSRQPELFVDSLQMFAKDETFDSVVATVTPPPESFKPRAEAIVKAKRLNSKPFLVFYTGAFKDEGVEVLRENEVAVFDSAGKCLKNLSHMVWYSKTAKGNAAEKRLTIPEARPNNIADLKHFSLNTHKYLSEFELGDILGDYGIAFAEEGLAHSSSECESLAQQIGYPVALKVLSPDIVHKTDKGCLALNVINKIELKSAYEKILANARKASDKVTGILVQDMIEIGTEVILGVHHDPIFGPIIMVGLGGTLTELIGDVAFGIPPLEDAEIRDMLSELKTLELLRGFRGSPKADLEALIKAVKGLSLFVLDCQDKIGAMDINPLMVLPEGKGCVVVDAYLELK